MEMVSTGFIKGREETLFAVPKPKRPPCTATKQTVRNSDSAVIVVVRDSDTISQTNPMFG